MSIQEKLRRLLESGKDWERWTTTERGVFILKIPGRGPGPASLAVELNPVDDLGQPTKRRGLILRSSEELNTFKELMTNEKLGELLNGIDSVNPRVRAARKPKPGEEVIQL